MANYTGDDKDNNFLGTGKAEIISGLGGDDILDGGGGNDTIIGGTGDDILAGGGDGSDTYIYARGDGSDVIVDEDKGVQLQNRKTATDVIVFQAGIDPSDIGFLWNKAGDLILSTGSANDQITIADFNFGRGEYQIEELHFSDGTVWNDDQIYQFASTGGAGDDILLAGPGGDTLTGEAGNDYLQGSGYAKKETLIGGTGDDMLRNGMDGVDTYIFDVGDGHDTIQGNDRKDIISFGNGISQDDVTFARSASGDDLIASYGDGDSIDFSGLFFTYRGFIDPPPFKQISFSDGTSLTAHQIIDILNTPTEGDDVILLYQDESVTGLGGDDYLQGSRGKDVLVGGRGNDTVTGGHDDDIYIFNKGDDHDRVIDYVDPDLPGSGNDKIIFGAGLSPAKATVYANADQDIVISFGKNDSVTIDRAMGTWFTTPSDPTVIERLRFSDGTVWSAAKLQALAGTPTDHADYLYGLRPTQHLIGLGGNDIMESFSGGGSIDGGTGDDTLSVYQLNNNHPYKTEKFTGGDGADTFVFQWGLIEVTDSTRQASNTMLSTCRTTTA